MSNKTIVQLAKEMYQCFEQKTREDGTKYWICNYPEDMPIYDGVPWMQSVIMTLHGDKLPDDTTYYNIWLALTVLVDLDIDSTESDCHEAIDQLEPDSYTSDLTAWLNARNDHVYYLTQAIEEYGMKDGFSALAVAQQLQRQEVGHLLVDALALLEIDDTEQ